MLRVSKHIALVGLSGSGKSTVGRALAAVLEVPFVDTDREIERVSGLPVHRIFAELGEPEFRRLESEQVTRALNDTRSVISLGGGALISELNRTLALERSITSSVHAHPAVLPSRLRCEQTEVRPLLGSQDVAARLAQLLEQRREHYAQAHLHVDTTDRTTDDVVRAILGHLSDLHES